MRIVFCANNSFDMTKYIEGNIIDIYERRIYPGMVSIENGYITSIKENTNEYSSYISPGFIDAHVHIESSMLTPVEFSKLAAKKGTIAVVSDPHEIANVLGGRGIEYMLDNATSAFIKIFFTIPSCVPATSLDFSGGNITADDVESLFETNKFVGLSEVMNVPGVLNNEDEIVRKIKLARERNLKIDGHAPGLSGISLKKYLKMGISSDHECSTFSEALEKIEGGMKILIREGSAAKNYDALKNLIAIHPNEVMFCTDDSHPDDLIDLGHIDKLVKRAIEDGFNLFDVFKIACINPVVHYNLPVGTLRVGDRADFVVWNNLIDFSVHSVYIDGSKIDLDSSFCSDNILKKDLTLQSDFNKFDREYLSLCDISKSIENEIVCIETFDGELLTKKCVFPVEHSIQNLESDIDRDILKIVYVNRYRNVSPQIAYIHGFKLKRGAFATSISHDSHNIIAVGCSDKEIVEAVNYIIEKKGGIVVNDNGELSGLSLPIAGIISDRCGEEVAEIWNSLILKLRNLGCPFASPFMTLSFMALIVIPELKIGENGLFEYSKFSFIS